MTWAAFKEWLAAMRRDRDGAELSPDSWAGYDRDPWYQEQRRLRDEERRR